MKWYHEKSQLQYVGSINIIREISYIYNHFYKIIFPTKERKLYFSTFSFSFFLGHVLQVLSFVLLR